MPQRSIFFVYGQLSCPSLVTCHWSKDKICKQIFKSIDSTFQNRMIDSYVHIVLLLIHEKNLAARTGSLHRPVTSDN